MEELKTIIVDDEEDSRIVLANLLNKFCKEIKIIGEADNVDCAYRLVEELKPDLIFLDIQMPTFSGFDLLKKFTTLPFEVIFVTSYDKYAINAIRFSALDYLLKPVEVNDLQNAVCKAAKKREKEQQTHLQVNNLLNMMELNGIEHEVAVHQNESVYLIKVSSIVYIEGEGRYCNIFSDVSGKHTLTKTLKEFEDFLAGNDSFIRVNKSYIINRRFIKRYSKQPPYEIELKGGKSVEISRRKRQEVIDRLKSL
jgi:two-component system LytT family response regulator